MVQALTVHWAEWPRSLLACARATSTQRLTRVVSDTAVAVSVPVAVAVLVAVPVVLVAVPVVVGVGVSVGVGCAIRVRVGTGAGEEVAGVTRVRVGTGVGYEVAGVADGEALTMALVGTADGDALAVGVAVGVAFGVGVFPDGDEPGAEVALALADALVVLGVGLAGCNGTHDRPLAVVAASAADEVAATARLTPEAAVSRTVPAIIVTVAGRACANRMKRLTSAARYFRGTIYPV